MRWPLRFLGVIAGLSIVLVGCATHQAQTATVAGAATSRDPSSHADAPLRIRLDHLRRLGMDATVRGRHVRVVALYAQAPDYHPVASPLRDGSEGIACVDDSARAAVVYVRHFEATGDRSSRDEATGLLDFVVAMEQGDGEFLNFIQADGSPNVIAPSSKKSFSYWAARAMWALGEAAGVLGSRAPASMAAYRPVLDRTVARFERDVAAGKLPGGSMVASAEALLGLLAYQRAEPSPHKAALAESAALLLARATSHEDLAHAPWGGRTDAPPWHAWGARATEALARAAEILHRPALLAAAREEADALWTRMLIAQQFPAEIAEDGRVRAYPQIAYGFSPIVEGFLAVADAASDEKYAILGGLAAAWFFGANRASVAMYDESNGRTFDGLEADVINRNAGAESTVEALLALGAVGQNPTAARHARYFPAGPATTLTAPGARRDFFEASSRRRRRVSLVVSGEPVRLGATVRIEQAAAKPSP